MVQWSPEKIAKFQAREAGDLAPPDPMADTLIGRLGQTTRLEIPFRKRQALKKAADLIRGFCGQMEFYATRMDLPEETVLFAIQTEARHLNAKLRVLMGPGKALTGPENF